MDATQAGETRPPKKVPDETDREHPVKMKLRNEILPWVESASLLSKQWFYRLHILFGYATDVTIGLGSIGIGIPLLALLTQPIESKTPSTTNVLTLLPRDPRWLYYLTALCVVGWIVLRVAFSREEGQKRAVLAKSCRQTMKQVEARLYQVLAQQDPMPELNKILDEQITPSVDRNIQEYAWPWSGPAPDVDRLVEAKLEILCKKFSSQWSAVGPTEIRR